MLIKLLLVALQPQGARAQDTSLPDDALALEATGEGSSRRRAEQEAASGLLRQLEAQGHRP